MQSKYDIVEEKTVNQYAGLVDTAYYRKDPPYVFKDGHWIRCIRQRHPLSEKQLREHLYGETVVFGAHGLLSPSWTAIDLDRCTGEGSLLTAEAIERYNAVQQVFDGRCVPVRSSESGNLNLWLHHDPIAVPLRDIAISLQLAAYDNDLHPRAGYIEYFPQPDINHRLPLGKGSVLLDPKILHHGAEYPLPLSKERQVAHLVTQSLYEFPFVAEALQELRAQRLRDRVQKSTILDLPPLAVTTAFTKRVNRWLTEGPNPGEHNVALGGLTLWFFIHKHTCEEVEGLVWEWQSAKASQCSEWQKDGPEACRKHIRRWVKSVERGYLPHAFTAEALERAQVPLVDVQKGLELFQGDITLQRAYFAFCRHVRSRLVRYYPNGAMPIHSHHCWRAWTGRKDKVFQFKLADAGICVPVHTAIPLVRSTLYRVVLPPAKGKTFTAYEEGVWEACGRDRSALERHFSADQIKRRFSVNKLGRGRAVIDTQ